MARITVAGQAIVVTSEIPYEDLERVKKYRPEALKIKGGDEGKDDIFVVAVGKCGEINKYGACFSNKNPNGKALITMVTTYTGDDIKEYIADELGASLNYINQIEDSIPSVLEEINEARNKIKESINLIS